MYLRVKVLTHLLRSFLEDKLRWSQADHGGLHERPRQHIRESDGFDESRSWACVPHAQVDFADVSHGDVSHGCDVAVAPFPLILQDDVAGAAVTWQGDLYRGNTEMVSSTAHMNKSWEEKKEEVKEFIKQWGKLTKMRWKRTRQGEGWQQNRVRGLSRPHRELDTRLWRSEPGRFDLQLSQHAGHSGGGKQQVDRHVFFGTDGQFSMSSQTLLGAKEALKLRIKANQVYQV